MRSYSFNLFFVVSFFITFFVNAQPTNDLCGNAEPIASLDGSCASYSNVGATAANPYYPTCFSTGGGNSQLGLTWFEFTAQGSNADITMNGIDRPEIAIIGLNNNGGTDLCDINDVLQYGCINQNGNYTTTTLSITNNSLIPGETYLIAVLSNSQGTFNLCVDNPINTSPQTCASADPFCTGQPLTFPASTGAGTAEPGNNYGCLITQPNPTWFFLEIDAPGDITLEMDSNPAEDIDYVAWGPFPDATTGCDNLTAGNVIDCSFAAATSETATIVGAQTGETYIFMITNFSNNSTDITFQQTGGAGSTNCTVLPVQLNKFDLSHKNGVNQLKWETGFESNNNYYSIERSTNGFDWEVIGRIPAGESSDEYFYTFSDDQYKSQINYYRLKQTDFNGRFEYLRTQSIDNSDDKKRKVVRITNMLGQDVNSDYKGIIIKIYDDGSTKREMINSSN